MLSTITLFTILVIGVFIYLPLYFKMSEYIIEKEKIEKKSGVIKQKTELLHSAKIQHTTIINAPFSFNCIIFISSGSKIVLPFLSKKDLEIILNFY
ncbi:MAG: hypothetical protein LBM93_04105 [Oscillospiraceae bacterium]|nr:hypothetical protein [Oscillospiraceae bacterium]